MKKELKKESPIPVMGWVSNDHQYSVTDPSNTKMRLKTRNSIDNLMNVLLDALKTNKAEPENSELSHYFTKGVYAREVLIPKGSIVVSRIHKLPRLCIISQGDVSYTTEYETRRVKAPYTAVFKPGTRVALFTHEDTRWTAIHGTNETDIDKLTADLIATDHVDYNKYCNALGFTEGYE